MSPSYHPSMLPNVSSPILFSLAGLLDSFPIALLKPQVPINRSFIRKFLVTCGEFTLNCGLLNRQRCVTLHDFQLAQASLFTILSTLSCHLPWVTTFYCDLEFAYCHFVRGAGYRYFVFGGCGLCTPYSCHPSGHFDCRATAEICQRPMADTI